MTGRGLVCCIVEDLRYETRLYDDGRIVLRCRLPGGRWIEQEISAARASALAKRWNASAAA